MVDFSTKQTGMTDVSGTSIFKINVSPGVTSGEGEARKKATTGLIGDIGEAGIGAMRGYAMAEHEKDLLSVIGEYDAPRIAREEETKALALEKTASLFAKGRGFDPALEETLSTLEKNHVSALERLDAARKQGVMTPDEFVNRVLDVTKQAVSKNPGLYNELKGHSSKVLELSGITTRIKADEKAAKSQQDAQIAMLKDVNAAADKYHVEFDPRTLTQQGEFNRVVGEINDRKRALTAADSLDRADKEKIKLSKETALNWIKSEGGNAIIGDTFSISTNYAQAFKNSSPKDYPNIAAQMLTDINLKKNRLVSVAITNGIINDPSVQDTIKRHSEALDTQAKIIQGVKSGEEAAKALQNAFTIQEIEQKYELGKKVNVPALEVMRNLPPDVINKMKFNGKEFLAHATQLTEYLMSSALNTPDVKESFTKHTINPTTTDALSIAIGMIDSGQIAPFEQTIKAFKKAVIEEPAFKTEEEKFNFLKETFQELGNINRKGKFKGTSTAVVEDTYVLLDEYMKITGEWSNKQIQEYKDQNITIKAEVGSDGRVRFTSPQSAAAADKMNTNFAKRFNDGISTIANITDSSLSEAAKMTYPRYKEAFGIPARDTGLRSITSAKQNVEIQTSEEAKKAFLEGNISEKEYKAILRDTGVAITKASTPAGQVTIQTQEQAKEALTSKQISEKEDSAIVKTLPIGETISKPPITISPTDIAREMLPLKTGGGIEKLHTLVNTKVEELTSRIPNAELELVANIIGKSILPIAELFIGGGVFKAISKSLTMLKPAGTIRETAEVAKELGKKQKGGFKDLLPKQKEAYEKGITQAAYEEHLAINTATKEYFSKAKDIENGLDEVRKLATSKQREWINTAEKSLIEKNKEMLADQKKLSEINKVFSKKKELSNIEKEEAFNALERMAANRKTLETQAILLERKFK